MPYLRWQPHSSELWLVCDLCLSWCQRRCWSCPYLQGEPEGKQFNKPASRTHTHKPEWLVIYDGDITAHICSFSPQQWSHGGRSRSHSQRENSFSYRHSLRQYKASAWTAVPLEKLLFQRAPPSRLQPPPACNSWRSHPLAADVDGATAGSYACNQIPVLDAVGHDAEKKNAVQKRNKYTANFRICSSRMFDVGNFGPVGIRPPQSAAQHKRSLNSETAALLWCENALMLVWFTSIKAGAIKHDSRRVRTSLAEFLAAIQGRLLPRLACNSKYFQHLPSVHLGGGGQIGAPNIRVWQEQEGSFQKRFPTILRVLRAFEF